jgi:hypothetical protein
MSGSRGVAIVWGKLDDRMPQHPKLVGAGPLAFALDAAAILYCCEYGTDGFVPRGIARTLLNFDGVQWLGRQDAELTEAIVEALVKVGRWEPDDERGGWWVHDFLVYNPSAEEVQSKREAARTRARVGRRQRWGDAQESNPNGVREESERSSRELRAKSERNSMVPSPSPKNISSSSSSQKQTQAEEAENDEEDETSFRDETNLADSATAVLDLLAEDDVNRRVAAGQPAVKNLKAYRRTCRAERDADAELVRRMTERNPGWAAKEIAGAILESENPARATHPRCRHCGTPGDHWCEQLDRPVSPERNEAMP